MFNNCYINIQNIMGYKSSSLVAMFVVFLTLFGVSVFMFKRLRQLGTLQQAAQQAWAFSGRCSDHPEDCQASYQDSHLAASYSYGDAYNPSLSELLAHRIVRIQHMLKHDRLPDIDLYGHVEFSLPSSDNTPFGMVWSFSHTPGMWVAAFRGTHTSDELLQDMEVEQVAPFPDTPAARVHRGFWEMAKDVWQRSWPRWKQAFASGALSHLALGGHSLGGAVAQLLAWRLARDLPGLNVSLYTYGSPRVGNDMFVKDVEFKVSSMWREVNQADIITQLPPAIMPSIRSPYAPLGHYRHTQNSRPFWLQWGSWKNNHSMDLYIYSLSHEVENIITPV